MSTIQKFEERVKRALALDRPYSERYPVLGDKAASVLVLLGFSSRSSDEGPAVLITKRTDSLEHHRGQMAFPGGACEGDECKTWDGQVLTALRETEEEVHIAKKKIRVLGRLPSICTATTGFQVVPVVGVLTCSIEEAEMKLNPSEIAEVAWISLKQLRTPGIYRREFRKFGEVNFPIHVYQVGNYRIWGATGAMIKNLLDRLDLADVGR